jgi:excisionase family DNA binding protein
MKNCRLQFDVRENTASSRQHASRLAVNPSLNAIRIEEDRPPTQQPRTWATPSTTGIENPSYAPSQGAATGGERSGESRLLTVREIAELLQVPISWVYGRMRKRTTERLPGFRLGKYWRFSEREVLAWLESQRVGPHDA